ncbi:MAG: hypothetical protein JKX81_08580, partial [Arenicella sp.]|nr:hypothetical protein [Arenicella sp.]
MRTQTRVCGLLSLVVLAGCTTIPNINSSDDFIASILNYEASLPAGHPDSIEQVYKLPDEVRSTIREKFTSYDRHRAASELAQWLMDPYGHNLRYDLSANLTPAQA